MKINAKDGSIVLSELSDFDINKIFDCGQCFRFEKNDEGGFFGVAHDRVLRVTQQSDEATLHDMSTEEFNSFWRAYFDLDTDYAAIRREIDTDDVIENAMRRGGGIRILHQDLFETIISFIISQNNNIPRIKKIISAICGRCGTEIDENGTYTFPTPQQLARVPAAELHTLGCGYRDEYISGMARAIDSGSFAMEELQKAATPQAREMLLSVKGIGGKVADCILLFGLHRFEVCPHDVWVDRKSVV